ncbi:BamA/TamA family outer membrane protein [Flavisolibacter sp. BT320]|nr:BamA/TamA family outer membrane protein [Flavisolibacter longurius]
MMRNLCITGMVTLLLLVACSPTKHIPQGDALYTGADVTLTAQNVKPGQEKILRADLKGMTRPKPNSRFLGIPFKLMLWNFFYTTKEKGLKKNLQNKLGEPPVLASDVDLDANTQLLDNYLENKGFFSAGVTADSTWKGKKASVSYTANAGNQYKIRSVVFDPDSSSQLTAAIREISENTLLKPGEPYDLDLIKGERLRIDALLKERGFYYFSPEHLLVQVDSTLGTNEVDMRVVVKPDVPAVARQIYSINDVYIYSNYSLNSARADTNRTQGVFHEGYYVIDRRSRFKPKLFSRTMLFQPGDVYNRTDHNQTLRRLMDLNVFKFVKNRFDPVAADSPKLNAYYYLTPQSEKAIRAEIGANTKSNNLNGSEVSFGFTHRNTFRGAEQMDIRAYVGTEAQFSGSFQGTSTFRIGGELNFSIPGFVTPFFRFRPKSSYIPRTNIQLGYEALNRRTLYTLNSFRGGFGYLWKESIAKAHEFYPIAITYVQPLNVTTKFDTSLRNNPTLRHIIDTQFILGSTYQYTFNQDALGLQRRNTFFFNGLADISGNVAGLLVGENNAGEKRLFDLPFSQYLKLEVDGRWYRRIGLNHTWANRIVLGYGLPYGNSRQLPYIKQFFTGGNNSIRAFRSRTVGPGTYVAPLVQGFIPDQTGDIKLELNTEFRPKISGPLYGALFVDAGNIWLANTDPNKPGGTFGKNFLKELAVGAGVGIRLDIQIFVIRLDVAFPIRKPWLADGERWVLNDVDFSDKAWRRENVIYNLAIGYPF